MSARVVQADRDQVLHALLGHFAERIGGPGACLREAIAYAPGLAFVFIASATVSNLSFASAKRW
jgi:hypothetical protein